MPVVFNIECHRLHYRPANTAFSAGYVSWLCPFQFTDQICTCQIVIHSPQITSTSYIISPSYDHSRVPTSPTYSSTSPFAIHTSHCHSMIVAVAYNSTYRCLDIPTSTSPSLSLLSPRYIFTLPPFSTLPHVCYVAIL